MLHKQHKTKGLRIDVQITDMHTQKEFWVDTTCIHPTCQTRIRSEMKHTQAKIHVRESLRLGEENVIPVNEIGCAVRDQTQDKYDTYAPLIDNAKKQANDGMRPSAPTFIAAVASTYGEFGIETTKLQEFLTSAYSRKLAREGDRDDGFSIQVLTADFRNRFKNSINVAVAKGLGRMINTCGWPVSVCRKYQSIESQ
jgi:hypothetical protein